MNGELQIIGIADPGRWREWLRRIPDYDFYDLPEYHALAQRLGEGEAVLLAYEEAGFTILLPLLLRNVAAVEGLEQAGAGLVDATSVYGYSGPLASHGAIPDNVIAAFQQALTAFARDSRIVAVFSRLHPLRPDARCLAGLGEVQVHGPTVSIDLTLPEDQQWRAYRNNHRRDVVKLRSRGYSCTAATDAAAVQAFAALYRETMERHDADRSYFFDECYFQALLDMGCFTIFLCRHEEALAAGALVSCCNAISQYHLGGTSADHSRFAPMKLVFDEARRWAAAQGCSVLHLGGGLGSQQDSLFNFKAGFSDRRHDFRTWRWVVDEARSAALDQARTHWASVRGMTLAPQASFPSYRRAGSSMR